MDALKSRIRSYWTVRAPSFAEQRRHELASEKSGRWLAELDRYLPEGRTLDILDVGTGSGFFCLLLARRGHHVTGVDLSEEMIRHARLAAEACRLDAAFEVMDAERPDYPAESFDAIVTRNLTWTLPHLDEAYRAWHGLLRPGGVLVNFDADYCGVEESGEPAELPENHAHKLVPPALQRENDDITMELSAYQQPRPAWDVELLLRAGFGRIGVDAGVWERVYAEIDQFYNPVPIFTLAAYKPR